MQEFAHLILQNWGQLMGNLGITKLKKNVGFKSREHSSSNGVCLKSQRGYCALPCLLNFSLSPVFFGIFVVILSLGWSASANKLRVLNVPSGASCTAVFSPPTTGEPSGTSRFDQFEFDSRVKLVLKELGDHPTETQIAALISNPEIVPPPLLPKVSMSPQEALGFAAELARKHTDGISLGGLMGSWSHKIVSSGIQGTIGELRKLEQLLAKLQRRQMEKLLAAIKKREGDLFYYEDGQHSGEDGKNKPYKLIRFNTAIEEHGPLRGTSGVAAYDYFARNELRKLVPVVLDQYDDARKKSNQGKGKGKIDVNSDPYENPAQLLFLVLKARTQELVEKWTAVAQDNREPWTQMVNETRPYPEEHRFDQGCVGGLCQSLLASLYERLMEEFPLDYYENSMKSAKEDKDLTALAEFRQHLRERSLKPGVFPVLREIEDLLPLPDQGVVVRYSNDLGTSFVHFSKGVFQYSGRMMVMLTHGVGTNNSNALSWANLFTAMARAMNSNLVAPDSPNAGNGPEMHVTDAAALAAVYVHRGEVLARWQREAEILLDDQSRPPLVFEGRSAGATAATLLLPWFYPGRDPYDISVGISTSNPKTIEHQLANVFGELVHGLIQTIDPAGLFTFRDQMFHFLQSLDQATKEAAGGSTDAKDRLAALRIASLKAVDFVGQADEDAGPTGIRDHQNLLDQYGIRSHFYPIRDPLKGTPFANTEFPNYQKYFSALEAKHFLVSSQSNVPRDQGNRYFPGLPMELLPKIRNQFHEINAAQYALQDYMISMETYFEQALNRDDLTPLVRQAFEAQLARSQRLRRYRDRVTVEDFAENPPATMLEWYMRKEGLPDFLSRESMGQHFDEQEQIRKQYVEVADSKTGAVASEIQLIGSGLDQKAYNEQDMAARFTRVRDFFELERSKTVQFLEEELYIDAETH